MMVGMGGGAPASKHHVPHGGIGNHGASGVLHLIDQAPRGRGVYINDAVPEFTDQHFASKGSETAGRNYHSPRCVQIALRHQPLAKSASESEYVHIACASHVNGIVLGLILQRVGDEELLIQHMAADWRVAGLKLRINESPG